VTRDIKYLSRRLPNSFGLQAPLEKAQDPYLRFRVGLYVTLRRPQVRTSAVGIVGNGLVQDRCCSRKAMSDIASRPKSA
jgi:hypothetical protein